MTNVGEDVEAGLRARIRDLETALGQNDQTLAVRFRLTPALANLFGLLLALPNVTSEMIRQRLEIATDAKVAVHRLRTHLKEWNIKVTSKRNLGYWFDDDTKALIRAMVTPVEVTVEAASTAPVVVAEVATPEVAPAAAAA